MNTERAVNVNLRTNTDPTANVNQALEKIINNSSGKKNQSLPNGLITRALNQIPTDYTTGLPPTYPSFSPATSVQARHKKLIESKPSIIISSPEQKASLEAFERHYQENHPRYQKVSTRAGVPAKLIAAINWRESGNKADKFNTHLHNGEPLGKRTTIHPKGILFNNWENAAVDALKKEKNKVASEGLNIESNTKETWKLTAFAEYYNGLGYFEKKKNSPYIFAGTNLYTRGKYVQDGKYDRNAIDYQPGIYSLLMVAQQIERPLS